MQDFQTKHPDVECRVIAHDRDGLDEIAQSEGAVGYYWDAREAVPHGLNAFFLPRLYLLDATQRVLYVEPPLTGVDRSFRDIGRAVSRRERQATRQLPAREGLGARSGGGPGIALPLSSAGLH